MGQKINVVNAIISRTLVLALFFSGNNVWASTSCPKPVSVIKQGEVATCSGFLFSPEAEQQAEEYRADSEFYKRLNKSLNEKTGILENENEILQKRLNLYITQSEVLSKDKAQRDSTETLYRFISFGLGVLVTGLIVRNVRP